MQLSYGIFCAIKISFFFHNFHRGRREGAAVCCWPPIEGGGHWLTSLSSVMFCGSTPHCLFWAALHEYSLINAAFASRATPRMNDSKLSICGMSADFLLLSLRDSASSPVGKFKYFDKRLAEEVSSHSCHWRHRYLQLDNCPNKHQANFQMCQTSVCDLI